MSETPEFIDEGEDGMLDSVIAALTSVNKKSSKSHSYQQSPAERRVDFAAIKKALDDDQVSVDLALRVPIRKVLDDLIGLIKRQDKFGGITDSFVMGLTLTTGPEAQKILGDYLLKVWKRGRELAVGELPEKLHGKIRKFAGLEPVQAINFFQNLRPWLIKGIIDDELKKSARLELTEHLKGGRTLTETIGHLRSTWEPWIGDPTKIVPSGITGMAEDILQAYRLENIVRTESITALSQGRAAVGDEAGDFVIGYQLSPILDERTCFYKKTMIKLANGTSQAIESIRPGDEIISGTGQARRVLACWRYPTKQWRRLTFSGGIRVICTPTHRFWSETPEGFEWTEAVDLKTFASKVGIGIKSARVNEVAMPSVWPEEKDIQQRSAQVLLPRMLRDMEEGYSFKEADMRLLQKGIREKEGGDQEKVLLQDVRMGSETSGAPRKELSWLRPDIPFDIGRSQRWAREVLQPQVLSCEESESSQEAMPDMREAVRSSGLQCRQIHGVFEAMLTGNEAEWRLGEEGAPQVCGMPEMASIYSQAKQNKSQEGFLFDDLSKTAGNKKVSDMSETIRGEEIQRGYLLLSSLLPSIKYPDAARKDGRGGSKENGYSICTTVSVREIHDRLLSSGASSRSRNGRDILAREEENGRCEEERGGQEGWYLPVEVQIKQATINKCRGRFTRKDADHTPEPIVKFTTLLIANESVEHFDWAYDLEIESDHSYIAEGLIVHNSEVCNRIGDLENMDRPVQYRKDDSRAEKLTPALHYQCRTIPVFITSDDLPVRWSTEAELDSVLRLVPAGFR